MRWISESLGRSEGWSGIPAPGGGASRGGAVGGFLAAGGAASAPATVATDKPETSRARRRCLGSRITLTDKDSRQTCQHPSFSPMLLATYQTRGACRTFRQAEIIPVEPDVGNATAGSSQAL